MSKSDQIDMAVLNRTILGIQDSHDAAACIVHGGRILAAVSEERVQRVKSAGGAPLGAIAACLDMAGMELKDIDLVALVGTNAVPVNLLGTYSTFTKKDFLTIQEKIRRPNLYDGARVGLREVFPDFQPKSDIHYDLDRLPFKESWELDDAEKKAVAEYRIEFLADHIGISKDKVMVFDHHTCHAYHAYYASANRGRPVTALTMDAGGDRIYESLGKFDERGRYQRINGSHDCIIGPLYTYITLLLGMRPFEHEFKVMGLAPYAKDHEKREAYEFFKTCLHLDGYKFRRNDGLKDLYWHPSEVLRHARFDGIAGGLQDFVEEMISGWVRAAIAATGTGDVVFGGGVALNVKANMALMQMPEIESLFVPPGPGDESLPIGGCWALMDALNPSGDHRENIEPMSHAYLGPTVAASDVDEFARHPIIEQQFETIQGDPDELAASALSTGEIVAVCRGNMEFGPRALGHRSILANASKLSAIKQINEAIKGRDFWMPFAPSIKKDRLSEYCSGTERGDYRFMTMAADSNDIAKSEIPAGLHPYDQTARAHSVSEAESPSYYRLLSCYEGLTGSGGVLNTSLNYHGKPIIMKPKEIAEEILTKEGIDLPNLLVGDRFFTRRKE